MSWQVGYYFENYKLISNLTVIFGLQTQSIRWVVPLFKIDLLWSVFNLPEQRRKTVAVSNGVKAQGVDYTMVLTMALLANLVTSQTMPKWK
jgi:hypothetical protein